MLKKLAVAAITVGLMSPTLVMAQETKKQEAREEKREGNERHPHIRAAIKELQNSWCSCVYASQEYSCGARLPNGQRCWFGIWFIRELQEARRELESAAHDFGGHRVEAIEAVDNLVSKLQKGHGEKSDIREAADNALKQLRQALQYDKK